MAKPSQFEYNRALEDFRKVRAKAELNQFWSTLTGKQGSLLPYDQISSQINARNISSKGLQEIPVKAIVGSVNRYQDFDKDFLPLHDESMQRWARVKAAMTSIKSGGLPPIKVYKIDDAYFVLDGNHRVSIAHHMGLEFIEAYVTEIRSKVKFSPEDSPETIIIKAEYAGFLHETQFDEIVPEDELIITFPGQYETIKEHINVHRYYLGLEQSREIPWHEAVRHWYNKVYFPVVRVIREQNILYDFPERTETDLYIWILDHQTYMEEAFGWSIQPEYAAFEFVREHSRRFNRIIRRIGDFVKRLFLPKILEGSRSPGEWFEFKAQKPQTMFPNILIALDANFQNWKILNQVLPLAKLEKSVIRGLIVRNTVNKKIIDEAMLKNKFANILNQNGLTGSLAIADGRIADTICDRARLNDLVVLKLNYPPSSNLISRLKSGMRLILRRSSRPILVVSEKITEFNHLLLAYDGSPKGKEALFISAYLAARYQRKLSVIVVDQDFVKGELLLAEAKGYLGGAMGEGIVRNPEGKPVSEIICQTVKQISPDVIIMGGYGLAPVMEIIFGSTVDSVLRRTRIPVLICQ